LIDANTGSLSLPAAASSSSELSRSTSALASSDTRVSARLRGQRNGQYRRKRYRSPTTWTARGCVLLVRALSLNVGARFVRHHVTVQVAAACAIGHGRACARGCDRDRFPNGRLMHAQAHPPPAVVTPKMNPNRPTYGYPVLPNPTSTVQAPVRKPGGGCACACIIAGDIGVAPSC
jgi:hypothetical protein